jgi:hypothetical protein
MTSASTGRLSSAQTYRLQAYAHLATRQGDLINSGKPHPLRSRPRKP